MMTNGKTRRLEQRKRRVRQRIFGHPTRPRLNVFRSKAHIYAQIIDDTTGRTLVAASTLDSTIRNSLQAVKPLEAAKTVGYLLADRAKAAHVDAIVFDRGGHLYHGRIKALAEACRERGLKF
jgi:large subunit ribosomal protein L18